MKQNNNSKLVYFSLWASVVLMLAMTLALVGVQPVFAQGHQQGTAATWYVAIGGDDAVNDCAAIATPCATINGALGKAAAGDTIQVASGTYTASSGTEVVLIAKDITLSGGWNATFDAQSDKSIIDGQTARRGITVNSAITATVNHFKIQNGFNSASGGGIYNRGVLTLSDSIISANISSDSGGGIDNFGTLTINTTTISGNSAGKAGYSSGGGGAGINTSGGTVSVNNSTISNNILIGSFLGSGIIASGTVNINNSTISANTGGDGSGIYVRGTVTLNNSTISANQSYGFNNVGGHVSLQNTIVAGNKSTGGDCYNNASYIGTVTSNGYTLIGKSNNCGLTASTGDLVGTIAAPIDARLGVLQDNGGPTFTHALYSDSPAVDKANPATPGSGDPACLATDQRGSARPAGSTCDIGAFEGSIPGVQSVKRASANPADTRIVVFTVTFSEPVTGVDMTAPFSDFALTTTDAATATIKSVTGSGAVYTVTANTGVGARTIRLDVIDDDSILNASSSPLGGIGAGNGNFSAGEVFRAKIPVVSSIFLGTPNPVTTTTAKYKVTFSGTVTGVDKTDFVVTKTGAVSGTVISFSGSGASYLVTVAVKTAGNGTLRLDVIDNDSIRGSTTGRPLGGVGSGNGNFKTGKAFTILTISTPQAPTSENFDNTPSYKWTKIPGATHYQYQLFKGAKLIYTKMIAASVCGSVCANTPTTVLSLGTYKWRVQGKVNGVWKVYSAYQTFSVVGPQAGLWGGPWGSMYVTPARNMVRSFRIDFSVIGCSGSFYIIHDSLVTIGNKSFSFDGVFHAYGTFDSLTSAHGTFGFNRLYVPYCNAYVSGEKSWTFYWYNSSQVNATTAETPEDTVMVVPASEQQLKNLPSFTADPVKP